MGTSANSENADEMAQNVAFYQGLHCLLRKHPFSQKCNIFGDDNL